MLRRDSQSPLPLSSKSPKRSKGRRMGDNVMNTRSWIATIVGIIMFFTGAVLALEARAATDRLNELQRVQLDHASRLQILEKNAERTTMTLEYIREKIDLINANLVEHVRAHFEGRRP